MGDRCSVEVLCNKNDAKRFEGIGFVQVHWAKHSDSIAHMFAEETDYGAATDLQVLAKQGTVFIGASGPGDEYSAAVFASDGKRLMSVKSLTGIMESQPAADIDSNGNADPEMMTAIKRYYTTLKAAKAKLKIA